MQPRLPNLAGIAALLYLSAAFGWAATIPVNNLNDSGDGSLRDAIAFSNSGDTIVFAVNGTINLTSGTLSVNHNLTIEGLGAPWQVIINAVQPNGQPPFRVFYFDNGTWTLANVTVSGGYDDNGGGIYNGNGNLTLSNCVVSGNTASFDGGGIYNQRTLTVNNCTIINNTGISYHTNDPRLDGGGGIYNSGTLTLTNSTLQGNSESRFGENGGGVYNTGTATVQCCTFYQNVANGTSTVYHNLGGAIFNHGGSLTVRNCTFSGNGEPDTAGGCIYNSLNATVSVGSSIFFAATSFAPPSNLDADAGATINSAGYNLSNDSGKGGDGTFYLGATGDLIFTDPKFDPNGLQYNGGYTDTIAIVVGSAAIDHGKSFGATSDQTGNFRTIDNPNVPNASDGTDVGAYESPADPLQSGRPYYIVTTTDDHDDGVCGASDCTLREAINRMNAVGGGTLQFAEVGTISLHQTLPIGSNISIQGPGARAFAISGAGASRVLSVTGGNSTISGLTIRDGNYNPGSNHGETIQGGGVYNAAVLEFDNCEFINNVVNGATNVNNGGNGGTGQGGAVFNHGQLILNGCTFSGNMVTGAAGAAFNGGGLLGPGGNGGAAQGGVVFNDASGSLSLINCTLSGNTAHGGAGGAGSGSFNAGGGNANGGAIYNAGNCGILACTISGNTGTGGLGYGSRFFHGPNGSGNGGVSATINTNLYDSIVAANSGNTAPDLEGPLNSDGADVIGIADQNSAGFFPTDQIGTAQAPLNPHLGPLQNNGGLTDTMALLDGSPAIDRGDALAYDNLNVDQRGSPRPIMTVFTAYAPAGGDGSDVGAVEMNLTGGTDGDHDGMSDDFEIFFGLKPNDPSDANIDSDNDGFTNLQEFIAGTDPTNPVSRFAITRITPGNGVTVGFGPVVQGKTYHLERKDSLTATSWTPIGDFTPIVSAVEGTISDAGAAMASPHFYHVRVP